MRIRPCMLAVLCLLFSAFTVRADVGFPFGRPKPPRPVVIAPPTVPLVVVMDEKASEPRLLIPRKVAAQLTGGAASTERQGRTSLPRLQTIVAGIALSLALVCGGLWLARSRFRIKGAGLALLLATLFLGLGSAVLWANASPLAVVVESHDPARPNALPAGITLSDKLTVEVVDDATAVRLIINGKQVAAMNDKAGSRKATNPEK